MNRSRVARRANQAASLCLCLLAAGGCGGASERGQRPPAPITKTTAEEQGEPPRSAGDLPVEVAQEVPAPPPVAQATPEQAPVVATTATELDDRREMKEKAPAKRAPRSERAAPAMDNDLLEGLVDSPMAGAPQGASAQGRGRLSRQIATTGAAAPSYNKLQAPMAPAAAVMPAPEMNTERYAHKADNGFERTADAPLSTFSIDVDTASYANVRRFLRDGQRPPVDAVRIEELVNYFSYDDPEPSGDKPFSINTEVAAAPWAPEHRLVRIGLRTRAIESARAPASNLVFLIDVSGSMSDPDKLPLLKRGLGLLAQNLRPQDRVAMVVYAGASGLALPSTSGSQRNAVLEALERLEAGGSTNGGDGIRLAYSVARQNFVKGGVNRVILATDGDFNVGTTSEGELTRLIEEQRKSGVFLTVLGFGRGNLNDSSMESLADHGNGSYAYVDSIAEAHKVLVREAGSTLVTVAKDVKLQVEWNPKRVASYRLIGFENRVLAARDFNDDKKDAGEIGAGHSMTALYEVVPLTAASSGGKPQVDPLRYQAQGSPTAAADSDELMTIKIRYKRPDADVSQLLSQPVRERAADAQASADLRWSAAVACFGMLLRDSEHKGKATLALADSLARGALGADPHGQRHEFVRLIDQARMLGIASQDKPASAQLAR
ncbi:MAG TPA: von Willebrand factor type A domain-containing protein [Polyangiales bacterium]|nr:von Willebrand factor type A domain-containing protein [Polyangiales bacterium]